MKKIILGTNWKMHKTLKEGLAYTKEVIELSHKFPEYQLFIIPPYTHLWAMKEILEDTNILLGAQNMHWEDEGAYTGEISPKMLEEIGIDLIEIGHSERRQYYNETDESVNKKVRSALRYDFTPLICIGERLEEKQKGISKEILKSQIEIALNQVTASDAAKAWLAYEPVWAIGEDGIPAEPTYIDDIHTYIREVLSELYSDDIANSIPVFYGGSVNIDNAVDFINLKEVDGLFIGRSAWNSTSFQEIMLAIREQC